VAAVIAEAIGGPAVVVGHSMGGRVAPVTALRHPELVEALVIVDSAMPLPPTFVTPSDRPTKVYATREEAIARFRLMPEQPSLDVRALAERSITERDGGWTWKFDPRVFTQLHELAPEDTLPHLTCPVALVQGELSTVTEPSLAADFARRLGRPAPLVTMPGVHHHMMLEDPRGLAAILDWLPETRLRTSAAAPATRR
jgi:pimeloyl-ACP methyl ester carboxylesterase